MPAVGDVARCPCGAPATRRLQRGNEALGVFCDRCATAVIAQVQAAQPRGSNYRPPPQPPANYWCRCTDPRPQPVRIWGCVAMLAGWWECAHCKMPVPGEWHDHDGNLVNREAAV